MSSELVRQYLEERLQSVWGARTPIAWDNVKYTPVIGTSFISCRIDNTFSELKSAVCQKETYLLSIESFTPINLGTSENMTACDDLITGFFNYSIGNLLCKSGRSERMGAENEWHKRKVLIDVQYYNYF